MTDDEDEDIRHLALPEELLTSCNETVQPDGGWGWVVCFSSFFCNGAIFGAIYAYGILYVAFRERYGEDDPYISSKAALIGSLTLGLTFLMGAVSGVVSDKIGIRQTGLIGGVLASLGMISSAFIKELTLLYLTFGVVLGTGFGFVYTQSLVILAHYFKRRLTLVNGICCAGGKSAAIAWSFGLPHLLNSFGIRYSLLFMSIFIVLTIPCTLTWKPVLKINKEEPRDSTSLIGIESSKNQYSNDLHCLGRYLNVSIWQNRDYVIYLISVIICKFGFDVPLVHLLKYSEDVLSNHNGHIFILYFSGAAIVAQLVTGRVGDFRCVRRLRLAQAALALMGLSIGCLPLCSNYSALTAISLLIGISYGASVCLLTPIVFDTVGHKNASQAMGFLLGSCALPSIAGTTLTGLAYDKLGSYDVAFYLAGCCMIAGMSLMFFMRGPPSTQTWSS